MQGVPLHFVYAVTNQATNPLVTVTEWTMHASLRALIAMHVAQARRYKLSELSNTYAPQFTSEQISMHIGFCASGHMRASGSCTCSEQVAGLLELPEIATRDVPSTRTERNIWMPHNPHAPQTSFEQTWKHVDECPSGLSSSGGSRHARSCT
jgi:hypothetical protein